jgi:dolichol-phosphate mannosyltransferase
MPHQQQFLIFIPTYNEAENVEALFRKIREVGVEADILFLDDNSPDGTGAIVERLAAENAGVFTIHRSGKLGIGSAHAAGIRWAYEHGYALLLSMDCDFTHSPEKIPEFVAGAADHDIVIGSRYLQPGSLRSWNLLRKTLTHTGHWLTTTLLRMPYDATGAFRIYRLDRIPAATFDLVYSDSYSFFFESLYVLWVNGRSIREIPLELPARTYGHSKMVLKDALRSVVLLGYLWCKTKTDRESLIYAEPFVSSAAISETVAQQEWDAYWLTKRAAGAVVYDIVAAFYRKAIIRRILKHFLRKHFPDQAVVLHAGCGSGQVDVDIADNIQITALDISIPALTTYRKCQPRFAALMHGSIFHIPAGAQEFEGIYNLGVMEHFTESEIRQILDEFNRVLKPGGKIALFWPPAYGLSVLFLASVHWFVHKVRGRELKLHPDELTHIHSRRQARAYLEASGFSLAEYYFGFRDLFTYAVIIGRKETDCADISARQNAESVRAAIAANAADI